MPHMPVPPHAKANARRMRHAMTEAELRLWNTVRAHRLMGLGFRRQMPLNGFILDFACPSKRLVVEVDGTQHARDAAVKADVQRTRMLEAQGWTVVRFWNHEVVEDLDGVCAHILAVIRGRGGTG